MADPPLRFEAFGHPLTPVSASLTTGVITNGAWNTREATKKLIVDEGE